MSYNIQYRERSDAELFETILLEVSISNNTEHSDCLLSQKLHCTTAKSSQLPQ